MTTLFIQNSIPLSRYFYLKFTISITALFSMVCYVLNGMNHIDLSKWSLGFVDLRGGAAIAIGSILMARVGAYVSFRLHPYRLKNYLPFSLSSSQFIPTAEYHGLGRG